MNMKKRLLSLALVDVMAISMAACSADDAASDTPAPVETVASEPVEEGGSRQNPLTKPRSQWKTKPPHIP